MARGSLLPTRARGFVMLAAVLALGSCSVQSQGIGETVAMIPGYAGGGAAASGPPIQGYDAPIPVIQVGLSETDATHMAIDLSQPFAPQGKVSFLVTNNGAKKHEFVVLATDTPAASFPIVSFEGEANRIDEDAKGVTNVGETGDMEPGAVMMLTLDLAPGHYAVVCNLPGHYAMGMHQDFFVTPTGSTPGQRRAVRDRRHPHGDRPVPALCPPGQGVVPRDQQRDQEARVRGACHRHPRGFLPDRELRR